MKASYRSIRIAPKKANLVATMIRGLSVQDARAVLRRTNKKGARMLDALIQSAVANAVHNENQMEETLVIRTLTVNKAQAYHRGVPMARGRFRPMRKFLSHIDLVLGVMDKESGATEETGDSASKKASKPVQKRKKTADSEKGSSPSKTTTKKKTASRSKVSAVKTSSSSTK